MAVYKNVSSQKIAVFAYDTANDTPKTGDAANITAQISLDGAATAATNDTNPTELDATDAPGIYLFNMTQAETNADLIILSAVSATSDISLEPVIIYTTPGDNTALNVNLIEYLGDTVPTADTAGYPKVTIKSGTGTGEVSLSSGTVTAGTVSDKTGYSLTATTGLGNQTSNITGNLSGSVGSVTGAVGSVTGNVGGNVTGSVGSVLGGINTGSGTITTLDGLNTAQDTQHSTTQTAINALGNNLFWSLSAPPIIPAPASGTVDYIFEIALYDGAGNPEAPDAAPTMAIADSAGTSLASRLGSTTGSLQSTGRYRWTYTASSSHATAQLLLFITVVEGGVGRVIEQSILAQAGVGLRSGAITTASVQDGAFTQGKFDSNFYTTVANNVLVYDTANCDGSAADTSLYTLIHVMQHSARNGSGDILVYQTDNSTEHVTITLTTTTTVAYVTAART